MKSWMITNKRHLQNIGLNVLMVLAFGVAFHGMIPWWVIVGTAIGLQALEGKVKFYYKGNNTIIENMEKEQDVFREFVEGEFGKYANVIEKNEAIILEQTTVIKEYEEIFDNQLVELPCVCGGNTFKGLFSQKTDNIVECEKCKNEYRVTLNYDSILIAENHNM